MKVPVTVFTPSHRPLYLVECYRSLAAQTMPDWEWIVLLNGPANHWQPPVPDERVRVVKVGQVAGVGAAKRSACALAKGDILVELDHDDFLAPTCLEKVSEVFGEHPDAVFVSSDWAQMNHDGSRNDDLFNLDAGWVYDEVEVDGRVYLRCHGLEPSPHNVGYIWYAPNHVRAFRRDAYERVGGYDAALKVLDDQELMLRLFVDGDFRHIPECLYLQRVHPANTQVEPTTNAFIQEQTVRYYQEHIAPLTSAWCRRRGLAEVTLRVEGAIEPVTSSPGEVVNVDPGCPRLPHEEGAVGAIHAVDVLQHLPDRAVFFNECHRVLAHAALLFTETPSTDGRGAFQDPSHVSWWNENSFWYVTQTSLRPSLPALTARFQISHLRTWYPAPWYEQADIPYVQANLLAVKDGPRQGGPLLC